MLEANPGFKSRISKEIYFEDYTVEELKQIFLSLASEKRLNLSSDAHAELEKQLSAGIYEKNFGNARGVRNLMDKAIRNKNSRISELLDKGIEPSQDAFLTILGSDLK